MNAKRKFSLLFLLLSLAAFAGLSRAEAASIYFFPNADARVTGKTFAVSISIDSPDAAMNAAQGSVSFPADKLEVLSLSKAGSIITLWVQEPSFSNTDGIVNFAGAVVNPGFKGAAGKILTIMFRAKTAGTAALSFSSASVLANDGQGTNILTSLGTAAFTLSPAPPGDAVPSVSSEPSPEIPTPVIDSVPVMDETEWYNATSAELMWNVPDGISGVEYCIAESRDCVFSGKSSGILSKKTYDTKALGDGVWHFSLRFKKGGLWGPAAVKVFKIDTTPPEPFSIIRQDSDPTNSQPIFQWSTTDQGSGIKYYEMKIGDGDWFDATSLQKAATSVLPPQAPAQGKELVVRAYDNAGNYRDASIQFDVVPKTGSGAIWYRLFQALNAWRWLIVGGALLALMLLYFFVFRITRWRRAFHSELHDFKDELRRDLKKLEKQLYDAESGVEVDLRPSHLKQSAEKLEKEISHIEADVKSELKKLGDKDE
jgi:hypothetical protein